MASFTAADIPDMTGRTVIVTGANSGIGRAYEILVRGQLAETMRHAFPGLEAERRAQDTLLRGSIPDQAALHGVLGQVEALGLELLDLRRLPTNSSPHVFAVDPTWWSWAGAHGGAVTSQVMRAMAAAMGDPARPPRTLHAHLLSAVRDEPVRVESTLERHGGSATVVMARATSAGRLVVLASAVFGAASHGLQWASRRSSSVPGPEELEDLALPVELVPFGQHLRIRPVTTDLPLSGGSEPRMVAWVRFADRRPVDAEAAVVLLDALPPALYTTTTEPVPVPTVEFAIHLAHPLHGLAVDDWVLVSIHTEHAGDGWAVDDAALHTRQGVLLATGRQTRRVLAGS